MERPMTDFKLVIDDGGLDYDVQFKRLLHNFNYKVRFNIDRIGFVFEWDPFKKELEFIFERAHDGGGIMRARQEAIYQFSNFYHQLSPLNGIKMILQYDAHVRSVDAHYRKFALPNFWNNLSFELIIKTEDMKRVLQNRPYTRPEFIEEQFPYIKKSINEHFNNAKLKLIDICDLGINSKLSEEYFEEYLNNFKTPNVLRKVVIKKLYQVDDFTDVYLKPVYHKIEKMKLIEFDYDDPDFLTEFNAALNTHVDSDIYLPITYIEYHHEF